MLKRIPYAYDKEAQQWIKVTPTISANTVNIGSGAPSSASIVSEQNQAVINVNDVNGNESDVNNNSIENEHDSHNNNNDVTETANDTQQNAGADVDVDAAEDLRVLSFNVWFADENWENRQTELINILRKHEPHVFCLQEVTMKFLQRLTEFKYIQSTFILSDIANNETSITPYGVMIAFDKRKFVFLDLYLCELESFMSRKLLSMHLGFRDNTDTDTDTDTNTDTNVANTAQTESEEASIVVVDSSENGHESEQKNTDAQSQTRRHSHSLWINTAHLESKQWNQRTRVYQLNEIFGIHIPNMNQNTGSSATSMFMGDFNYRDALSSEQKALLNINYNKEGEENNCIPKTYKDCWTEHCNNYPQSDDNNNDNATDAAATVAVKFEDGWTRRIGYRYDRILLCSDAWTVHDFQILGNAETQMPSDHKGVITFLTKST